MTFSQILSQLATSYKRFLLYVSAGKVEIALVPVKSYGNNKKGSSLMQNV